MGGFDLAEMNEVLEESVSAVSLSKLAVETL